MHISPAEPVNPYRSYTEGVYDANESSAPFPLDSVTNELVLSQ